MLKSIYFFHFSVSWFFYAFEEVHTHNFLHANNILKIQVPHYSVYVKKLLNNLRETNALSFLLNLFFKSKRILLHILVVVVAYFVLTWKYYFKTANLEH